MNEPQTKYSFVTKYVLANPKNMFMGYEYFSLCPTVPVAVENTKDTDFREAVKIPTKIILPLLIWLKESPAEISNNTLNRTVYKIELKNNKTAYVIPDVKYERCGNVVFEKRGIAFNVTPEINRAIIDCIKTFTRS